MRETSAYLQSLKINKNSGSSISTTTPQTIEYWNRKNCQIVPTLSESRSTDYIDNTTNFISSLYGQSINSQVGLSIGASQVFFQAIATLTKPGDSVILECPNYEPMKSALKMLGLKIIEFRIPGVENFSELDALRKSNNAKLVILTSPNVVTGKVLNLEQINFLQNLQCPVIVDECYLPLFQNKWTSFDNFENIISISNFSKPLGLSSLRVGWFRSDIPNFKNDFERIGFSLHVDLPTSPLELVSKIVIPNFKDFHKFYNSKVDASRRFLVSSRHIFKDYEFEPIQSNGIFFSPTFEYSQYARIQHDFQKSNIFAQSTDIFGLKNGFRISINSDIVLLKSAIKLIEQNL